MSKHPVKIKRTAVRPATETPPEVITARALRRGEITFSYTHASISLGESGAHVKARRVQLTDGRLESETIEGDVDPTMFGRAVVEAQRQFLAQTALLWQPFASMLPFFRRDRERE
jgi:hypothetical protein